MKSNNASSQGVEWSVTLSCVELEDAQGTWSIYTDRAATPVERRLYRLAPTV